MIGSVRDMLLKVSFSILYLLLLSPNPSLNWTNQKLRKASNALISSYKLGALQDLIMDPFIKINLTSPASFTNQLIK